MSAECIPASMVMATSAMANLNRNRYRLETASGSGNANPGSIITINLPEGGLVDTSSFKLFFKATATGNGTSTDEVFGRFPRDAASLISRVEVYLNGVSLSSISDYNVVHQQLKLCDGNPGRDASIDRACTHGSVIEADANEVAKMCIQDWDNILNKLSTRYLPLQVLGQISIRLTMAGNEVLVPKQKSVSIGDAFTGSGAANAAGIAYSVSDIYATIDSLSVGSGEYEAALRQRLIS